MVFVCVSCDCVLRIYSWIEILVKKLSSHLLNLGVTIPFLLSCCCHSCFPFDVVCLLLYTHFARTTLSCILLCIFLCAIFLSSSSIFSSATIFFASAHCVTAASISSVHVGSFIVIVVVPCLFYVFAELRPRLYLLGSQRVFAKCTKLFS